MSNGAGTVDHTALLSLADWIVGIEPPKVSPEAQLLSRWF